MPHEFGPRSRKGRAVLAGVILLIASLGSLAVDSLLQARLARRRQPQPDSSGRTQLGPSASLPGGMPLPLGEPAPALDLPAVEKAGRFLLASHRGSKPVVLVFGSLSCDLLHAQIPDLDRLYRRHRDRVTFAFIAIHEAGHPLTGYEFLLEQNKDLPPEEAAERRRQCVARAMTMSNLALPGYLDKAEHTACEAYKAWPRRLVVVGSDGRIAHDFGAGLTSPWDLQHLSRLLDAEAARPPDEPANSSLGANSSLESGQAGSRIVRGSDGHESRHHPDVIRGSSR